MNGVQLSERPDSIRSREYYRRNKERIKAALKLKRWVLR